MFQGILANSHSYGLYGLGSSGVELASGLHWFIKNHCQGMITWKKTGGKQINGEREGSKSSGLYSHTGGLHSYIGAFFQQPEILEIAAHTPFTLRASFEHKPTIWWCEENCACTNQKWALFPYQLTRFLVLQKIACPPSTLKLYNHSVLWTKKGRHLSAFIRMQSLRAIPWHFGTGKGDKQMCQQMILSVRQYSLDVLFLKVQRGNSSFQNFPMLVTEKADHWQSNWLPAQQGFIFACIGFYSHMLTLCLRTGGKQRLTGWPFTVSIWLLHWMAKSMFGRESSSNWCVINLCVFTSSKCCVDAELFKPASKWIVRKLSSYGFVFIQPTDWWQWSISVQ